MSTLQISQYFSTRLELFIADLLPMSQIRHLVKLDAEQQLAFFQQQFPALNNDHSIDSARLKLSLLMLDDFRKLLRPFSGNSRRYLNHALHWFELVNLKVLIRGKFSGNTESEIRSQLTPLGNQGELPVDKLIETDDAFEMLRQLETTTYGNIVRQARRIYDEQGQDLFALDSAIDKNYFIELSHRARFLPEQEQKELNKIQGILLDRFNLLWLIRFRFSYGLSASKAYYLLTASGQKLNSERLMRLAQINRLEDLISALPEPISSVLKNLDDIYQIENFMELYCLDAARKGIKSQQPVTRLFSYLLLREAQTRVLLAITKGKQLGFSEELINQAIGEV